MVRTAAVEVAARRFTCGAGGGGVCAPAGGVSDLASYASVRIKFAL